MKNSYLANLLLNVSGLYENISFRKENFKSYARKNTLVLILADEIQIIFCTFVALWRYYHLKKVVEDDLANDCEDYLDVKRGEIVFSTTHFLTLYIAHSTKRNAQCIGKVTQGIDLVESIIENDIVANAGFILRK